MSDATPSEIMATAIARDLRTSDRLLQSATNMPVARAAVLLAALTRLPDSRVVLGLAVDSPAGQSIPPDTGMLFDATAVDAGESRWRQSEIFDDVRRPDVFFVGGYQVDRRGNVNLQGLAGEDRPFRLRGPGPGALASMSTTCAGYYAVVPRHDERRLPDRVDHVTALSDVTLRRRYRLPGGGLRMVVTPLATLAPGPDGDLELRAVHPGVDADEVRARTGFPLAGPARPPVTPEPTAAELALLRRIGTEGRLR